MRFQEQARRHCQATGTLGAIRAVKKKKETFREKTVYRSLLLILTLALLAFTHVSQSGLSFSRIELGQIVLSFFLFFEKKVSFWRMFFTPENFFVGIIAAV